MTPTDTPPPSRDVRADAERERAAVERLGRLRGTHELQAALMALLLPQGSKRALIAWRIDNEFAHNAQALLDDVLSLRPAARLPWFERLLVRLAAAPLAARKTLLESTRRLMSARGRIRPIDRLHWLAMRQRLGEPARFGARAGADGDISQLQESAVLSIAAYSAFLARMVPGVPMVTKPDAASTKEATARAGAAWYATVMAPWQHRADVPDCVPPSVDGLVLALQGLRTLPWLQRPVVVRGWVGAAVQQSRHGRLDDTAADALRLSCTLLDCPLPPALTEHYIEAAVPWEPLT